MADQVGWRNIHALRAGVEAKPRAKWMLALTCHSWWLASARDGLYNASGAMLARVPDGSAGRHVGQELDVLHPFEVIEPIRHDLRPDRAAPAAASTGAGSYAAPMRDYGVPGVAKPQVRGGLAGVIGAAATFVVVAGIGVLLQRRGANSKG